MRFALLLFVFAVVAGRSPAQLDWVRNPANGHLYAVTDPVLNWATGESLAQSLGGHLVTIRNQAENNFVESLLDPVWGYYWIGYNRVGTSHWNWSSGEPVTFVNWYYPDVA